MLHKQKPKHQRYLVGSLCLAELMNGMRLTTPNAGQGEGWLEFSYLDGGSVPSVFGKLFMSFL